MKNKQTHDYLTNNNPFTIIPRNINGRIAFSKIFDNATIELEYWFKLKERTNSPHSNEKYTKAIINNIEKIRMIFFLKGSVSSNSLCIFDIPIYSPIFHRSGMGY
jgi:hypothetical protein